MRITKWHPFWNYEKEEKWLNENAKNGNSLVDYFWMRYVFEKTEPNKYIYRIDLLPERKSNVKSIEYLNFMEENGIECIATYFRWAYFRKENDGTEFNIYSDLEGQINKLKRIYNFYFRLAILEFSIALLEIIIGLIEIFRFKTFIASYFLAGITIFIFSILFINLSLNVRRKIKQLKKEMRIKE